MGYSRCFHLFQGHLKGDGIWCGNGIVKGFISISALGINIDSADDTGGESAGIKDTFQNPGCGGFTVGACEPNQNQVF